MSQSVPFDDALRSCASANLLGYFAARRRPTSPDICCGSRDWSKEQLGKPLFSQRAQVLEAVLTRCGQAGDETL